MKTLNLQPLPYERKYLSIGKRKLHKSICEIELNKMANDFAKNYTITELSNAFERLREYMYYIKRSIIIYNNETMLYDIYKYK